MGEVTGDVAHGFYILLLEEEKALLTATQRVRAMREKVRPYLPEHVKAALEKKV